MARCARTKSRERDREIEQAVELRALLSGSITRVVEVLPAAGGIRTNRLEACSWIRRDYPKPHEGKRERFSNDAYLGDDWVAPDATVSCAGKRRHVRLIGAAMRAIEELDQLLNAVVVAEGRRSGTWSTPPRTTPTRNRPCSPSSAGSD